MPRRISQCSASLCRFRCANGNCVQKEWRCDAEDDCGDNSDELNCTSECKNEHFKCLTSGMCVNNKWKCDGEVDCPDASDERGESS